MAKKKSKSRPKKPKPLLVELGIIHLEKSFVHPSEESGLLSTVGGGLKGALVLAPNYGYGMHISDLQKTDDISSDEDIPDEVTSSTSTAATNPSESESEKKHQPGQHGGDNGDKMTVAELVRSIGGATKDTPLTQRDVVRDELVVPEAAKKEKAENDPVSEEFYASLGMSNKNLNSNGVVSNGPVGKSFEVVNGQVQYIDSTTEYSSPSGTSKEKDAVEDSTQSIADYYKNYCQYYYSVQPNPYGDERLEIGQTIEGSEDIIDEIDENVLNEARLAQINRSKLESSVLSKLKATEQSMKGYLLNETDVYDPLPMEAVPCDPAKQLEITTDTTLDQLWDFVKENPLEFSSWIYLIQYAEASKGDLQSCRQVYSAFLPLFPYCFGYWKRYAELEKSHYYRNRALSILKRALDYIPLSVDLWLSNISLYSELHAQDPDYENLVRQQYENALNAVGKTFTSDSLWDAYIQWETYGKRMKRVLKLYGKLLYIPTRLYNRHWDNFKALLRDYHPRDVLFKEDYEKVRKKACKVFGYRYVEEPEIEPGEIRKTSKPEDKLMDYIKTKLLDRMTIVHQKCEKETDLRWDFEDKIKRPYFHAKALDNRQLRNWFTYLDFEISKGDHERIVLLFERCLISCAKYETFWCKYARYLEKYYRTVTDPAKISSHIQKSHLNAEIVPAKQVTEEENLVDDASYVLNCLIEKVIRGEEEEMKSVQLILENLVNNVVSATDSVSVNSVSSDETAIADAATTNMLCVSLSGDSTELPPKSEDKRLKTEETSKLISFLSIPSFQETSHPWQEIIREVFKRACVVHCSDKPTLRLQWAAFEEEMGNVNESRELITYVLQWFPEHLNAKLHLLELERRAGNIENLMAYFDTYLDKAPSKEEYSMLSIKYARFLYKERGNADKALAVLRKALKKDKSNPRLYSYVFEICYERFPTDKKGAAAALELALLSKELTESEKLQFLKKKVLFHQEHGDLRKFRDSTDALNELQATLYAEAEAARQKEEQEKWYLLQLSNLNSNHEVNLQPFPVPTQSEQTNTGVPIHFDAIIDPPEHLVAEPDQTAPFKSVPPTEELIKVSSNYGYGGKHPDFKLAEQMAQKEYEKLESIGYPEQLKDKECDKVGRPKLKRKIDDTPLFIVPPKGAFLANYLANKDDPDGIKRIRLEPPMELSALTIPGNSPCVNIPDWFVKEGGELCLSQTPAGFSMIRYWPHFLTDMGNKKMFKAVRRCVKWHQKQICVRDRLRWIPRLVSWLGPCEYSHTGLTMAKNEDWPPEILNLLHRLNQLTNNEFNSCSMNLYRTGHDSNAWHADVHPGLGSNPAIASVSLGALRTFELKRKGPHTNFIRFPLFPGSLLLMEGATQADWVHQVPKEPLVKEERINLTFRVMHAVEEIDRKDPKLILTGANKERVKARESSEESAKSTAINDEITNSVETNNETAKSANKINESAKALESSNESKCSDANSESTMSSEGKKESTKISEAGKESTNDKRSRKNNESVKSNDIPRRSMGNSKIISNRKCSEASKGIRVGDTIILREPAGPQISQKTPTPKLVPLVTLD